MLYSDGVNRDQEPEINRMLREMTLRRLDKLIVDLESDRLLLLVALERQGKVRRVAGASS